MSEPKDKLPLWMRATDRDPNSTKVYEQPFERAPTKNKWAEKRARAKAAMKRAKGKGF